MSRIRNINHCLLLVFSIFISLTGYGQKATDKLEAEPHFGAEAKLVSQILDSYHFKKIKLNDSLSSIILDEYIATLDNNRSYFLASDIKSFEKYRNAIDDLTKMGNVSVAYEIYDVFKKRFEERMAYVKNKLIPMEFDYTLDEEYNMDRSEASWMKAEKELNDLWRKIIKSQSLSLKLNGKKPEEIQKIITERYERFEKAISQYEADDIFELYMNNIAEAFDPHTNYFSPRTSERFEQNMSLSLEGIGARLQSENDYTKVVQILPGGPAEKSDLIHENDRIVGVAQGDDGEMVDVIGWRLDDVVDLIKGPKGTVVRLEILPAESGINGKSEVITLTREKIKLEDLQAKAETIKFKKDGRDFKIGVITVPSFYMEFEAYQAGDPDYNSTTRDVRRLVEELKDQNIDGLMMDLRNNGGGSLAEAIDLTGLFIKDGPVVQVKTSSNQIEVGEDEDPSVIYDGPMAVLINRFSASASEIFAGAIQDYQRGIVLGEQTFGKGTVQSVIDLSRYLNVPGDVKVGQLKITLQKFYRVTGSSTQHLGVNPDIAFPSAFDADEFGESSSVNALPWDQIKSTNFDNLERVSPQLVSRLTRDYDQRLLTDPGLKALVTEANELKEALAKNTVSLNEEQRRKEMEEAQKKTTQAGLSGANIAKEGKNLENDLEMEDKYLKEGVIILSEVITEIG